MLSPWLLAAALAGSSDVGEPSYGVPVALTFLDARTGHVLMDGSTRLELYATSDGGESWTRLGDRIGPSSDAVWEEPPASKVHFADASNGWVYGPRLFATHDGGRTWAEDSLGGGDVRSVDSVGGTVWALVVAAGEVRVMEAGTRGTAWKTLARLPAGGPEDSKAVLRRLSAREAWIFAPDGSDSPGPVRSMKRVWRTGDGGNTWKSVGDPCLFGSPPFALTRDPADAGILWMLCTSGAGEGTALYVLRSADDGLHWTSGPEASSFGVDAFAVSATRLWFSGGKHGCVLSSTYPGPIWELVLCDVEDFRADWRNVFFVDGRRGWATRTVWVESDKTVVDVFRTLDGGETWTGHRVAPARSGPPVSERVVFQHREPPPPPTPSPPEDVPCMAQGSPSPDWARQREEIYERGRQRLNEYLRSGGQPIIKHRAADEPMGVLEGSDDAALALRGCIEIRNMWREVRGEEILSVYAGAEPRGTGRGLLVITRRSAGAGFSSAPPEFLHPPTGLGPLSIEDAAPGPRLRIRTSDGLVWSFDVSARRWRRE